MRVPRLGESFHQMKQRWMTTTYKTRYFSGNFFLSNVFSLFLVACHCHPQDSVGSCCTWRPVPVSASGNWMQLWQVFSKELQPWSSWLSWYVVKNWGGVRSMQFTVLVFCRQEHLCEKLKNLCGAFTERLVDYLSGYVAWYVFLLYFTGHRMFIHTSRKCK